ncbi:hypothetical protein Cni_G26238 [Canna indica]|uniref:DUF4283 domain-containing protein n=1 Tax=Canna indica TaxID=4628 RepID=A0AAQ3QQA4_9LILI|nr:hypothetical protein Cni_G26238 [Canna indica]
MAGTLSGDGVGDSLLRNNGKSFRFLAKPKKPSDLHPGLRLGRRSTDPRATWDSITVVDLGEPSRKSNPTSRAALFRGAQTSVELPQRIVFDEKIKRIQVVSTDEIRINDELIIAARSEWRNSLYGKFYGNTPPLSLIQQAMPRIWKLKCSVQAVDLAAGYFCFKFSCAEDMNKFLYEGPWFFRGQALLLTP